MLIMVISNYCMFVGNCKPEAVNTKMIAEVFSCHFQ